MGIVFHQDWRAQQDLYTHTLPQGHDAEQHYLEQLAEEDRFAQWLHDVIPESPVQPNLLGQVLPGMIEHNSVPHVDLVVLHGVHTSPANPSHVTVQAGNSSYIGHIDVTWRNNRYEADLSNFTWMHNPRLARAVDNQAHRYDVRRGVVTHS